MITNYIQKLIYTAAWCAVCVLPLSCSDDLEPSPSRQGNKPDPITSYTVKSIAGGAVITYELPDNSDLRYVKAAYRLSDGSLRENKASVYHNSILVDGFAEAGEYEVDLIAVSVGEVNSDPTPSKLPR